MSTTTISSRILSRTVWTIAAIFSLFFSILVPFALVRYWSEELAVTPVSRVNAGKVAPRLRHWRNQLAEAGNDYFIRVPLDSGRVSNDDLIWAERTLVPKLDGIMEETGALAGNMREAGLLVGAVLRFRLMLKNSGEMPLRRQAAAEIRLAIDAVEEYIALQNLEGYCRESPTPFRF